MTTKPIPQEPLPSMAELNRILAPYQKADTKHSLLQLANTLIPYFGLWVLMAFAIRTSYWLTLALAVVAALFLVRVFIFFHDCGHNSFFPDKNLNKKVGFWLGVLVFTPSEQRWHSHAIHHATSGNLDKRGVGDVATLTLEEYLDKEWAPRLGYRMFRNPLVMFVLGPLFMFLIMARFARPKYGKKQTMSVVYCNLALLGIAAAWSLAIGWQNYLLIQVPVMWMAGALGIYMFYLQHQFEETYWERDPEWNYVASALLGASYYKLPKVLAWFTGNIGFHHIHHLSPRIPNYNLDRAHENSPLIQKWARQIDFLDGLRTVRLKVWDEPVRKLRGFPKAAEAPVREAHPQAGGTRQQAGD